MREVGQSLSAQLIVTPMESADYISDIKAALAYIEESGLKFEVGPMSTVVSGSLEDVLRLVSDIYKALDKTCKFALDIRLSNGCGF